jgi:putative two-component system response regulator
MDSQGAISGHVLLVGPPPIPAELEAALSGGSWRCLRSHTPGEALWRLRSESIIDAILVIPSPETPPFLDLCRHVKLGSRNALVGVIFALGADLADRRIEVFDAGADDCIQLPATSDEIAARLLNAVRFKRAADSLEDATAVITSLANAIEGKDHYTCGHVERVATYSVEIARSMRVEPELLASLKTGALVHDIGKVAIPDQILNKPGRLTDEERRIVERHPLVGHDILKPLRTFQNVLPIVRWHHERPNGKGYPDRLEGEAIPPLPRIVAVADCFDALSTDRPYRPALPLPECRDILQRSADDGDLDARVVEVFFQIIGDSADIFTGAFV